MLPRWLVLAPPALLFLASLVLIAASIRAWGAGEAVELPAWMTTFAGLLIALPAAVTGAVGFYEVHKRTDGDFGADHRGVAAGVVWLLAIAAAVLLVAARIGEPATYDPLRDEEGNPEVVPGAFMLITVVGTACLIVLFAPSAYVYSQAFWPDKPNRLKRRPNERDFMGEYFRGRGRFERFDRHRFDRPQR